MKKKVIIAGGTGMVGRALLSELTKREYAVVILSRDSDKARTDAPGAEDYVSWSDTESLPASIDGSYGIIILSGSPIAGKRWTEEYKKTLRKSRIETTKTLVQLLGKIKQKPKVLVNGSAVGFYGVKRTEKVYDEAAAPGDDFLANLCVDWENEAIHAEKFGVRVVRIRSAVILNKSEGALPQMMLPFQLFMGGPIGSGKQPFPWIHLADEVGIICFALENAEVSGPLNAVSPGNVDNKTFAHTLGKVLNRPSIVSVPPWALSLIVGEAASFITSGVAISDKKIIDLGYTFKYPTLITALENILKKSS